MAINLNDTGIDSRDPQYRTFLNNLQGNILKPHGREYTRLILLSFSCTPWAACVWLRSLVCGGLVTSAWEQHQQTRRYRKGQGAGKTFGSVLLSASGYQNLGIPEEDLPRLFSEDSEDSTMPRAYFRNGMAAARGELQDSSSSRWEASYRGSFDAMVLLADDDVARLGDVCRQVKDSLEGVAGEQVEEKGRVLRNLTGHSIEHFGNVDGVSQPLFLRRDLARARKDHGATAWDPSAPLNLVLLPDPLAQTDDAYGSYMVYRKLQQDVHGYRARKAELAKAINQAKPDKRLAGAMIIGRFADGTPVVLDKKPHGHPLNNFDYSQDRYGRRCPFQAHIRKVNPRGGTATDGAERRHRIARRGVPFGEPGGPKGLLFMCYQRSIARQFAFLQRQWANNVDFLNPGTGIDPLIGEAFDTPPPQKWPTAWGGADTIPFDFHGFVSLRGGEFFFAPSLPFLSNAVQCLEECGVDLKGRPEPHHHSSPSGKHRTK